MKICYLSNVTQHLERLATAMHSRGHEVMHITFYDAHWPGVKIYNFGKPSSYCMKWFLPISAGLIKNILKKAQPDILHAHHIFPYGIYACYSGFQPYVLSAWGSDVITVPSKYPLAKRLICKALKNAVLIHTESEHVKKVVIELGTAEDKITVFPFGIDLNLFQPLSNLPIKNLKQSLGIDKSKVVISVRKFEKVFNIDCLLRAIPIVRSKIADVKFIIKGFGRQERTLKRLAAKLGIMECVTFVGKTPFSDMPLYLNSADVYVSTAIVDSTSVSMLEAMACSLPIITTALPANLEWIKNGWNGFLFKPANHKELAEKIIILLRNPDMCSVFGLRNRKIVEMKADWRTTLDSLEKHYSEIVQRWKS